MLNRTVVERIPPGFLVLLRKEGPERLACVAPWWFLQLVQGHETLSDELAQIVLGAGFCKAFLAARSLEPTQCERMWPGMILEFGTAMQKLISYQLTTHDALQAAALEEPEFALLCRDHVLDADTRTKCIYLAGDL